MRKDPLIFRYVVGIVAILGTVASFAAFSTSKAETGVAEAIDEVPPTISESAAAAGSLLFQKQYRYVRCNSSLGRRRTCDTFGKNPVKLWRRHSMSGCVKKRDWNTTNGGRFVWVNNGCQATFQVRMR